MVMRRARAHKMRRAICTVHVIDAQWPMDNSNFAFVAKKTVARTAIYCADRVKRSIGSVTSVESERGTIPSSCVRSATDNFEAEELGRSPAQQPWRRLLLVIRPRQVHTNIINASAVEREQ